MRRMITLWVTALVSLGVYGTPHHLQAEQGGLRVLISVDMEGVAGAVTGDQLGPTGFEYGRFASS